jgi:DNA polymerase III delta prime subunit
MHKTSLIIQTKQIHLAQLGELLKLDSEFEWTENNPDLLQISTSENSIGIGEAKKIVDWSGKQPFNHEVKVGIIWEAEKLTPEAQNSLLKTLEEPAQNTLIVLVTGNISGLLSTILSRCQVLSFGSEQEQVADETKLETEVTEFIRDDYLQKLSRINKIEDRAEAIGFVLKLMQVLISNRAQFKTADLNQYLDTAKSCYIGLKAGTNIKLTLQLLAISMENN